MDKSLPLNIKKSQSGVKQTHGCVYYTKNSFLIKNEMNYYNANVKIHLVKVTDLNTSVRDLIDCTAHTNTSNVFNSSQNEEIKDNIQSNLRGAAQNVTEQIIDDSNIPDNAKEYIKKFISSSHRSVAGEYGKIPDDQQYSDPNTKTSNKFSCSFQTSLNTKLTDSVNFNDRARIVHTWSRQILPKSTWKFNLTSHLFRGININYLFDVNEASPDHPVGYIFSVLTDRPFEAIKLLPPIISCAPQTYDFVTQVTGVTRLERVATLAFLFSGTGLLSKTGDPVLNAGAGGFIYLLSQYIDTIAKSGGGGGSIPFVVALPNKRFRRFTTKQHIQCQLAIAGIFILATGSGYIIGIFTKKWIKESKSFLKNFRFKQGIFFRKSV